MLKIFIIILGVMLTITPSYGKGGRSSSHRKSPSLSKINTTIERSATDTYSFIAESNLYRNSMYGNMILDYTSASGYNVQLAGYNVAFYEDPNFSVYNNSIFINLAKSFRFSQFLGGIVGTQNGGYQVPGTSQIVYQSFNYGIIMYQVTDWLMLRNGLYWANAGMTGLSNTVGYLPGFTLNLYGKDLTLQGDYYSGSNNVSGAVVNLQYNVTSYFSSYLGVGVPEKNSGNEFYGNIGFILSSKGLF